MDRLQLAKSINEGRPRHEVAYRSRGPCAWCSKPIARGSELYHFGDIGEVHVDDCTLEALEFLGRASA